MLHVACGMRPYMSPLLFTSLLLLLLLIQSSSRPGDIVRDTCQKIAAGDPNVNCTFCVDSLDSVRASRRAGLKGLALIATRLATANATNVRTRIKRMLKKAPPSEPGPYFRSCLETCLDVYSDAVPALRDSARAVRAGRYDDANAYLSSVLDAPDTCEDGFRDGEIESPLAADDGTFGGLACIALGITAQLQGH